MKGLALVAALLAGGCYDPAIAERQFSCSSTNSYCPGGLTCDPCSYFCVLAPHACDAGGSAPPDGMSVDQSALVDAAGTADGPPVCTGNCVPPSADLPDDQFVDANGDGIDGDQADAVFVDPINGDDVSGDGTMPRPKQHLAGAAGALALAQQKGKHQILISSGSLNEGGSADGGASVDAGAGTMPLALVDGISIFGGYDSSNHWQRSAATPRPTLLTVGVRAIGLAHATVWDRVDVTASDAIAPGASSYAFLVGGGGAALTIRNVTLTAGNGADGVHPSQPAQPPQGGDGDYNWYGWCRAGQTTSDCMNMSASFGMGQACVSQLGGTSSCGGFRGGTGSCDFNSPTAGDGPGGGSAATASAVAGFGASGMAGTAAATGGGIIGSMSMNGYADADGHSGAGGAPGSGGGGGVYFAGYCSITGYDDVHSAGGGGGVGGCGGAGGLGGGGGGGAFALYVWGASPLVSSVKLATGNGGKGGEGGVGGQAGLPGHGGSYFAISGGVCNTVGGGGGSGGKGGNGSGGGGGPAIGLETAGGAQPTLEFLQFAVGTAGAGGKGASGAADGAAGTAAKTRSD